jgi:hypothetical protein
MPVFKKKSRRSEVICTGTYQGVSGMTRAYAKKVKVKEMVSSTFLLME